MHPIILKGKVIKGKSRGAGLGFPTANIKLHQKMDQGIYISKVHLDKKTYPALTFIGAAETFAEKEVTAESYLLNFKENLYGKIISVTLLKKIRDSQKFKSANDLITQMEKDKKEAQIYFKI